MPTHSNPSLPPSADAVEAAKTPADQPSPSETERNNDWREDEPFCRDCADHNGICPWDGTPCDPSPAPVPVREERQEPDEAITSLWRELREHGGGPIMRLSARQIAGLFRLFERVNDQRDTITRLQSSLDALATATVGCKHRQYDDGYTGTCGEDRFYCEDCRDKLFAAISSLLSTRETSNG